MPDQKASFETLVDEYYEALFRFGISLAKNENDASDLVQQTFVIWAEKGHTLKDPSKAKSWLFTSLYREFLRIRRKQQHSSPTEDEQLEYLSEPTHIDFASRVDAANLLEILEDLDSVYREPLVLFYIEDLSYREISEILDVPLGTIMSRLSRGKSLLKTLLTKGFGK